MLERKRPETWFWSHDIKPTPAQLNSVAMPGWRLVRLSSYGQGAGRRLASLVYKEPGPARSYALDLDASALAARLRGVGGRPVTITAGEQEDGSPRFSVVLETGPGPLASVHTDLDETGVRGLIDDHHVITDLATYVAGGVRKFAAIVEERPGPSWFITSASALDLAAKLIERDAVLVRLRRYVDAGRSQLCAVAERAGAGSWAWYADLDADAVSRNLEMNSAYPIDLDATRDSRGVRFTVVMYRDR